MAEWMPVAVGFMGGVGFSILFYAFMQWLNNDKRYMGDEFMREARAFIEKYRDALPMPEDHGLPPPTKIPPMPKCNPPKPPDHDLFPIQKFPNPVGAIYYPVSQGHQCRCEDKGDVVPPPKDTVAKSKPPKER